MQPPTPEQLQEMQASLAAAARQRGLTTQQFAAQQRAQLEASAKEQGMTVEQFVAQLRQEAYENHNRQQQQKQRQQQQEREQAQVQQQEQEQHQHQHQHQPNQSQKMPIKDDGTVDPRALALAKWLRGQDLKTRTCLLNGQRKDMFRVKRALRAIESPAYAKAAAKANSGLPPVTSEQPSAEILKLLPLSFLAVRVTKVDPNAAHQHAHHDHDHDEDEECEHDHAPPPPSKKGKGKRVKGLWTVRVEPQQDIAPELHYAFLYDGPQWRAKLYAAGALAAAFAVVLFPLWPLLLRRLVWQASMAMLGLIGLFFVMSLFRLVLFCATVFTVPPGLWLYPNLFEDVGFFDSFRPVWGWHETEADKKAAKKAKRAERKQKAEAKARKAGLPDPEPATSIAPPANEKGAAAATTSAETAGSNGVVKREMHASVEEAGDSDSE